MAQIVIAIAAVVGAAASIYSAHQQADAAKDQRKLAEQQAKIDAENRESERQRLLSQQRAAFGAAGVDTEYGTPLAVYSETNRIADEDISNILSMGATRGRMYSKQGQAAKVTGYASAAGTLLKGAGYVADYKGN